MPFLAWTENLSVGVFNLDAQHKRLIELVNQLHDAMVAGQGRTVLQPILNGLVKYTATHFASEEKYMEQTEYTETNAHKSEHHKFTRAVLDFKQRYDTGQTMLTVEVMMFLKSWLVSHIQGSDRKYAPRQTVGSGA